MRTFPTNYSERTTEIDRLTEEELLDENQDPNQGPPEPAATGRPTTEALHVTNKLTFLTFSMP